MRLLVSSALLTLVLPAAAQAADVLFSHPPIASGTLLKSSYWDPDGGDYDEYVWDAFTLGAAADITQVRWRGGSATGSAAITDFEISIWASIPAGIQPDIGNMNGGRLAHFTVGSNAGQTSIGSVGGTPMYDYQFTLPHAFHAAAGTKYWIQIEGWTAGMPVWGLATGSGGSGTHFHRSAGMADARYYYLTGNAAFTLIGNTTACSNPTVTVDPAPVTICNFAGAAVFNVAATGTGPFTYRWRQNGYPVYNGPNGGGHGGGATISGATTPTLTIDMPSYWADIGTYDCVVTNACGSTPSAGASLTFSNTPVITSGPQSQAACPGSTVTLSVVATNTSGAVYEWRNTAGPLFDGVTAGGSVISGSATSNLRIDNVQSMDADLYTCTITSDCGIAEGSASISVCAADFDCDGTVDFFDYDAFVICFEGGACPQGKTADFDQDGTVDFFDYDAFVRAFESGC